MKTNKMILAALLTLSGASYAGNMSEQEANELTLVLSTMSPFMITSAPTATLAGSSNYNDVIMVNDDAVIAMETGFISDDLASVVEKLKVSDAQFAAATDAEIVKFIAEFKLAAQ